MTLNTVNIDNKDFKWSSNFNISFNKNKVLELAENQTSLLSTATFDQNFNSQPNYIAKIGQPMGMITAISTKALTSTMTLTKAVAVIR